MDETLIEFGLIFLSQAGIPGARKHFIQPVVGKIKKYITLLLQRRFDFILQAIAWSMPRWLFFYNHAIYITSDAPTWERPELADCIIKLARPEDAELFETIGTPKETALTRLEAGDRAAIVLRDGKIMAAVWGGRGQRFLIYSGTEFDPGNDGVFYYGAFTKPEARLRGYYLAARTHLHESFKRDGKARNWSAISANYPKWLGSILKRNFTRVGETFYIKVFFVNFCYYRKWFQPRRKIRVFFHAPRDVFGV